MCEDQVNAIVGAYRKAARVYDQLPDDVSDRAEDYQLGVRDGLARGVLAVTSCWPHQLSDTSSHHDLRE